VIGARRVAVQPFSEREIAMLEAFAQLAATTIQNARLLDQNAKLLTEVEARNRDLEAALERERAMSEVLRIIARSPTELRPVLDAICERAAGVVGAEDAVLRLADGHFTLLAGHWGSILPHPDPIPAARQRAISERRPIQTKVDELAAGRRVAEYRIILSVPLIRNDDAIGMLNFRRRAPVPYTDQQIGLLEAFADQAVIAIENVRLFREINERNAELREALEQQTATAEVLRIIAKSPTELHTVLQAICESAARVCGATDAAVRLVEGDMLPVAASCGDAEAANVQVPRSPGWPAERAIRESRTIHIADIVAAADDEYPEIRPFVHDWGIRTMLLAPLRREGEAIGVIVIRRVEVEPFSPAQIALLETFANQAVIAIENARLYDELQEKNAELGVASQHKSDFLANMSHELRTPLNAIISFSEILQEDAEDAGDQQYVPDLQEITSAGKHLLGLINDILDLSKIEAGRMDVYLETFAVADLLREVQAVAQPLVEKKGNTLLVKAPADLGEMHSDLTKLKQSLLNLLSNAAKFTEQGAITLRVAREPGDPARVTFSVTDTGIGMTPEQLGRLFQAFSQAEASTSKKYGGTGLGLALTRQFCYMLGGEVSVTSKPGAGSVFTLTLPADATQPLPPVGSLNAIQS